MLKETPQTDSGTTLLNLPQNFSRACKDTDSTCARTDLVYVHPPPEEKPPSVPKVSGDDFNTVHYMYIEEVFFKEVTVSVYRIA